tara:strand:+ start:257 stop:820 length:564 start_codon:yes stop_codon:yes gene_type:complete
MKNQENKKKEILKSDDKKHSEKLEILRRVKDPKEKQLIVNFESDSLEIRDRLKEILNKSFDDPEAKYNLYYKGIRHVLMQYLPKGKDYETERNVIYDEKNVFLNRGKAKDKAGLRGSDGRMTYNDDMGELADLIADWVMSSQDPVDLYQRLYDLNEKYEYGHQDYDDSSKGWHRMMKKIAKVPKPKD